MDRVRKLELIQRTLGLRHKLKVHESLEAPETHEDLAIMLLAKWELEDELHAIEAILGEARVVGVKEKTGLIRKGILGKNSNKNAVKKVTANSTKASAAKKTKKK